MKKQNFLIVSALLLLMNTIQAQSIELVSPVTFEEFLIPPSSGDYWNGSDGTGNFTINNVTFQNEYDDAFGFWSKGWAVSKVNDNTTEGFTNLFGCYAGLGFSDSPQFAVGQKNAYITFDTKIMQISLKVTNSTYAGLSMKNGDSFAKKFGGVSGNDPDFFKLVITSYFENQSIGEPVEFYLADYRFENNNEDYIINEWRDIIIEYPAGTYADSISFDLESSDVGAGGFINTPAFFCVDYIIAFPFDVSIPKLSDVQSLNVFPNPANSELNIDLSQVNSGTLNIFNIDGKKVLSEQIASGSGIKNLDVSSLVNGFYLIEIQTSKNERMVGRFVKSN